MTLRTNRIELADGSVGVDIGYVVNGSAKAWGFSTYSGGTPSVTNTLNVSSLTDNATGDMTYSLTNAMADTEFNVSGCAHVSRRILTENQGSRTVSSFRVVNYNEVIPGADDVGLSVVLHGDLA